MTHNGCSFMRSRALCTLLVWVISIVSVAQNISFELKADAPEFTDGYNYQVVTSGNPAGTDFICCILEGSQNIRFDIGCDNLYRLDKIYYQCDNGAEQMYSLSSIYSVGVESLWGKNLEPNNSSYNVKFLRAELFNLSTEEFVIVDINKNFSIYYSSKPAIEWKENLTDTSYLWSGENIKLELLTTDHPSGFLNWNYEWSENNSPIDNSSSELEKVLTEKGEYEISVHATYKLNDGTVWYDTVLTRMFYVCSVPSAPDEVKLYETFSDRDVVLKLPEVAGGYADGRTYKWYAEGTSIIVSESDTCKIRLNNSSNTPLSVSYKCIITDRLSSSDIGKNVTITYKVTVYSNPKVAMSYKSNNVELESSIKGDTPLGINAYEGFGGYLELSLDTEGGNPDGWGYQWIVNQKNINNPSSTYRYNVSGGNAEVKVMAINYLSNGDDVVSFEKIFDIKIHDVFTLDRDKDFVELLVGENDDLKVVDYKTPEVGNLTFSWSCDGKKLNGSGDSYTVTASGNSYNESNYEVVVVWTGPERDEWYRDTLNYTVYSYPKPVATKVAKYQDGTSISGDKIDCYYNTPIYIGYQTEDNGGKWKVSVTKLSGSGSTPIKDSENIYKINNTISGAGSKTTADTETRYRVEFSNLSQRSNKLLGSGFYEFIYHAWSTGGVKQSVQSEYKVLFGETISLDAPMEGGYDKGWTFTWNDERGGLGNSKQYDYIGRNNEKDPKSIEITLRAKNSIGNIVGIDTTLVFNVAEYAAFIDAVCNLDTLRVREGDVIPISLDPPRGGNPNGWRYKWIITSANTIETIEKENEDGQNHNVEFVLNPDINPKGKHWEEQQCSIEYWNENSNGDIVIETHAKTIPVKVYRVPEKPSSLVQKGSGKSNIFIALYDAPNLSQSELENLEYKFSFIYANDTIQNGEGGQRYIRLTDEQKNNLNEFFVCAYWEYNDFICYSNPVSYGGTRVEEGALSIKNNYFYASVDIPVSASVTIYSMTGQIVRQIEYPAQTEFAQLIDWNGLTPGIYVMQCVVGEQRVASKVVVK